MADVFISYVREDQPYTRKLADSLRQRGFEVWMDDRIDFGDRWWQTIVQAIRASAAFVVVMTPDAEKSEWVEREVMVALDEGKPIFPLLLRGQRFPLLVTTQYADVTDGRLPPDDFYERLEREVRAQSEEEIVAPVAPETVRQERVSTWQRLRLPLELAGLLAIVLLIGVIVVGLVGGGEEPALIPTTSVPVVAGQSTPTHTPRPAAATSTPTIVVDTPPPTPYPSPTATSLPTATDTPTPTSSPTATTMPTPVPPAPTNTSTAMPVTEDTPIPTTTYTLSPTSVPTETPLSGPTISADTLATSEALPTPTVSDSPDQRPDSPFYVNNVGDALNQAGGIGCFGGVVVAVVAVTIVLLDSTEPKEMEAFIVAFFFSGFLILGVYYLLLVFVVSMWCRIWGITPCIPGDTLAGFLTILYFVIIAIILYNYKDLMKWLDL